MGVAALVLGILGIVLALMPSLGITQMIGVVLGLLAVILGVLGRRKAQEEGRKAGIATAGLVVGIVAIVFAALLFAACTYFQHRVARSFQDPKIQEQFRRGFQEGIRRGIERHRHQNMAKPKAEGSLGQKRQAGGSRPVPVKSATP